jgi:hypothetical protein
MQCFISILTKRACKFIKHPNFFAISAHHLNTARNVSAKVSPRTLVPSAGTASFQPQPSDLC